MNNCQSVNGFHGGRQRKNSPYSSPYINDLDDIKTVYFLVIGISILSIYTPNIYILIQSDVLIIVHS